MHFIKARKGSVFFRRHKKISNVSGKMKITPAVRAVVHLDGIFAPLNTGLVQISRSHFKQSKNSMLKT